MSDKNNTGEIVWRDLTVKNADEIRNFYQEVAGWQSKDYDMGDYSDYVMSATGSEDGIAGICHARGENSKLPPQWLIYVKVESVEESVEKCIAMGGKVIDGPRVMGESKFSVIQDPAGAVFAIID